METGNVVTLRNMTQKLEQQTFFIRTFGFFYTFGFFTFTFFPLFSFWTKSRIKKVPVSSYVVLLTVPINYTINTAWQDLSGYDLKNCVCYQQEVLEIFPGLLSEPVLCIV